MQSTLIRLTAGANPVSLKEAKAFCNVFHNDDDELITSFLAAALTKVDGPDGELGRALLSQQWKMICDGFGDCFASEMLAAGEIELPLPPIISIDSITYLDSAGSTQTLSSSVYRLLNRGTRHSSLMPKVGQVWPSVYCDPEAVTITFTAGYDSVTGEGENAVTGEVPSAITLTMKKLIAHFYANREISELPSGIFDDIGQYRAAFFL